MSVFVNAIDGAEAERKALEILSTHPDLTSADHKTIPEGASISFKVVHELEHHIGSKVTTFQFFEMDE